jgi:hypothetical protein
MYSAAFPKLCPYDTTVECPFFHAEPNHAKEYSHSDDIVGNPVNMYHTCVPLLQKPQNPQKSQKECPWNIHEDDCPMRKTPGHNDEYFHVDVPQPQPQQQDVLVDCKFWPNCRKNARVKARGLKADPLDHAHMSKWGHPSSQ